MKRLLLVVIGVVFISSNTPITVDSDTLVFQGGTYKIKTGELQGSATQCISILIQENKRLRGFYEDKERQLTEKSIEYLKLLKRVWEYLENERQILNDEIYPIHKEEL